MAAPVQIGWNAVVGAIYARAPLNGAGPIPDGNTQAILKHLAQSPFDYEFHEAVPVTLLAGASRQEVVRFTPSGTRCGIVRGLALGVAVYADFDFIRWAVMVDDTPWPGYDSIVGPFGVFLYPKPILIPLYPNQTVKVVATNLKAPPVNIPLVTGYLMGTHFAAESS